MRIAFVTAGAAGMYCGNCLRDNALARAMLARGHEVLLVPTYTPTRTDEPNVSLPRVFLSGISVYLQQKLALFRHTPRFVDRLLSSPRLLSWVTRRGMRTDAAELGALTAAMLAGGHGPNRKEFVRLVDWLVAEAKPDVVDISNALLLGLVDELRPRWAGPIVCTLSGEDLFIDQLPEPHRTRTLALMREQVARVDAFVTFSDYYAAHMAERLHIARDRIVQVPLGISLDGHAARPASPPDGRSRVVGYLARICPEKGLHLLCDAFRRLHERPGFGDCELHIAGYLGARDRPYFDDLRHQIAQRGLDRSVRYIGEVDRAGKIRLLRSADVFCLPTVYRESKGLPVLEAWANAVPVVLPSHGIFPELIRATGGGLLVPPNDPAALADALSRLLDDPDLRRQLGASGRSAVERSFTAADMASATLSLYERLLEGHCRVRQ